MILSPQITGAGLTGGSLYVGRATPDILFSSFLSPQITGAGRTGGPLYKPGILPTAFNSLQAVQDFWESTTAIQSLVTGGKLWHKSAPENASIEPYATFFLVSEVPITFTTAYAYWESTFQINIHHNIPQTAIAIAKQISDALNSLKPGGVGSVTPGSPQIQVFGQNALSVLPGSFGVDEGEGLGLNGRDCWICHFEVVIPWTN
jgi:hypothetical protein